MRRLELDFLRFIAVLLVLGRHMHPVESADGAYAPSFSLLWQTGGWVGVDLFFVLSGFLVSGLLFREYRKHQRIDAKRFLVRRGFKIYPSFWVLIAVSLGYVALTGAAIGPLQVVSELLFVQNYIAPMWNHTWSLAVEEHFYLLLTLYFVFLTRRKDGPNADEDPFRVLPMTFAMVATTCLFFRSLTATTPFEFHSHMFATHLRVDSLLFGTLLAYWWEKGHWITSATVKRNRWWFITAGVAGLSPAMFFPQETTRWIPVFGVALFYLASGAILIGTLHCQIRREGLAARCAAIGAFSYSIYLWHMPVHNWLTPAVLSWLPSGIGQSWIIYLVTYISLSFVLGVFACRAIEAPLLMLRDRIFPSRTAGLEIPTAESNPLPSAATPTAEMPREPLRTG